VNGGAKGENLNLTPAYQPKEIATVNMHSFPQNSGPTTTITSRAQEAVSARGWRRLALPDLETLILKIQRSAARQHLSPAEWRALDRMRARRAALLKESVS
jgi:hypothetical protein